MARIDLDTITHELLAEMELKIDRILADVERIQRWIPVKERLPEDDGDVLVVDGGEVGTGALYGQDDELEGMCWMAHGGWHLDHVTHWMPLPEPPEVER